jgi:hypothetical protein
MPLVLRSDRRSSGLAGATFHQNRRWLSTRKSTAPKKIINVRRIIMSKDIQSNLAAHRCCLLGIWTSVASRILYTCVLQGIVASFLLFSFVLLSLARIKFCLGAKVDANWRTTARQHENWRLRMDKKHRWWFKRRSILYMMLRWAKICIPKNRNLRDHRTLLFSLIFYLLWWLLAQCWSNASKVQLDTFFRMIHAIA